MLPDYLGLHLPQLGSLTGGCVNSCGAHEGRTWLTCEPIELVKQNPDAFLPPEAALASGSFLWCFLWCFLHQKLCKQFCQPTTGNKSKQNQTKSAPGLNTTTDSTPQLILYLSQGKIFTPQLIQKISGTYGDCLCHEMTGNGVNMAP